MSNQNIHPSSDSEPSEDLNQNPVKSYSTFNFAFKEIIVGTCPGIVGAFCNTYVGHPFDTVRVRMQDVSAPNRSAVQCFTSAYKNEGLKGLYKGAGSSMYAAVAENSVVFGVNEVIKRNFYQSDTKRSLSLGTDMLIGSVSGFAATIVACPFETVKCRMQINESNCPTKRQTIVSICKELKISGLYSGFSASCSRNIPYYLLFFPLYSRYIDLLGRISSRPREIQGVLDYAVAGGMSGMTTWTFVYPFDVIKCNQQIYREKINMWDMCKLLYGTKGIQSFYAGFYPTMIRAFFANASLLFGIEFSNKVLGLNR